MTIPHPNVITELIGHPLWYTCSSCKTKQRVERWGVNICKYKDCPEKSFVADYDPDDILKQLIQLTKEKKRIYIYNPPKLQKVHNGTILVNQGGYWKDL
jgi:hypothetical protein